MITPSRNSTARDSSSVAKRTKYSSKKKKQYQAYPTVVKIGKQPIPKQLFNRLKYAESVNVTLNVSGLGSYIFSCNGMYDPNITGTGHQPMYFDQFSALYDHYTVLKSKMKCTVVGHPNAALLFGLGQDDDTTIAAPNSYTMWERPGFQVKSVNAAVEPSDTFLWSSWDAKKVYGGDPQSDPELQGTATSNPTEQTYYIAYFDGGVTLGSQTVTILAEIWYEVVWDEFVSMASS